MRCVPQLSTRNHGATLWRCSKWWSCGTGPHGVIATELLQSEGGMHGAVKLQASWDVLVPAHLEGIVQLQTSAKVNDQGAVLAVWFLLHSYLRIAREVLGQSSNCLLYTSDAADE